MPDRKSNLRQSYGITEEHYQWLLEHQGGACAICGNTDPKSRWENERPFYVDHCHDTGAVRGLLCMKCNTAIGMFKDRYDLLIKAADYVKRIGLSKELVAAGIPEPLPRQPCRESIRFARVLDWDGVKEIRRLGRTTRMTQRDIGEMFGVSQEVVSKILLNKTWFDKEYIPLIDVVAAQAVPPDA